MVVFPFTSLPGHTPSPSGHQPRSLCSLGSTHSAAPSPQRFSKGNKGQLSGARCSPRKHKSPSPFFSFFKNKQKRIYIYIYLFFHVELCRNTFEWPQSVDFPKPCGLEVNVRTQRDVGAAGGTVGSVDWTQSHNEMAQPSDQDPSLLFGPTTTHNRHSAPDGPG